MLSMSLSHPVRTLLLIAALLGALALPATARAASPVITIGPVDCDAGGSVVTVEVASGAPVRVRLLRDQRLLGTMVVPAGAPVTRVVPIAEGSASRIDVRHVDTFTSAFVRRDCSGAPSASAPANSNAEAPFVDGPVVPGTGVRDEGRGAAPAAVTAAQAAQQAAASDLASPSRTLPIVLALIGAAALLAAALVAIGVRRNAARERAGAPEGERSTTQQPSA